MGQTTMGVLYGVKIPNEIRPYDDDADDGGLLEAWHKVNKERRGGFQLDSTNEMTPWLMGYWVVLDRGGEDKGLPAFNDALPFAQIEKLPAFKKAQQEWKKFAAWAVKRRSIKLPAPQLWLTGTEVA